MTDLTSNITAESVTAEAIAAHEAKFAVAPVAPVVTETDHELIASDLRAENTRLKASLAAVRLGTTPSGSSNNGKPLISAARFRAEVGLSSLRGMPVDQKLQGLGLDPATVSIDHLERLFCLGNDGVAAAELMRASPKRYRQLREAADLLGIYGSRPSSKR
jgi:hypothetical protein